MQIDFFIKNSGTPFVYLKLAVDLHFKLLFLGERIQHGSDLQEHRQKLIEIIINEQKDGRGKMFPTLLPYTLQDLSQLFQDTKNTAKYTILVLQTSSDIIGPELALDLHRVKELNVRYAYNDNKDLVHFLKADEKFPQLYAIDRDLKVQGIQAMASTREAFRAAIRLFLEPKHIDVPTSEKHEIFRGKWMEANVPDMASFMHERERKALKEKIKKMGDVVFQMDLEAALRYVYKIT